MISAPQARRPALAVVVDLDQAKWLPSAMADRVDVVALAPDAARHLRDRNFTIIDGDAGVRCVSHARAIVLLNGLQQPILDLYQRELLLSDVERDAMGHYLFQLIATANLARQSLLPFAGHYEEYSWMQGRKRRMKRCSSSSFEDMLFGLVANISPFPQIIEPGGLNEYSALHGRICNMLNQWLGRQLADKKVIAFLDNGNPLARKIASHFPSTNDDYVLMSSRPPATTILGTLIKFARRWRKRSKDGKYVIYAVMRASDQPPVAPVYVELPDMALMNATLKRLVEHTMPRCFVHVRREVRAAVCQMEAVKPALVVGDHMFFANRRQAARIQRDRGLPVLQVTHGSHAVPQGVVSQLAARLWAEQGRLRTDDVTHVVPKTPGAAALIDTVFPQSKAQPYAINLFERAPLERETTDHFTVVIGGNYQDLERTVPWQMEFAYEYQRLIFALIDQVAAMDDVVLKLRVKPTKSEGLSILDIEEKIAASGASNRIMIETKTKIHHLLATTDLMISNLSTLADEALMSRVPVMLMTHIGHYHHWPARTTPPTVDDRASVYGCPDIGDFPQMITAIKAAHHGKPLSEGEVAPYAWPDDTSAEITRMMTDIHAAIERGQT
ncbi:MAG: hypothetical protein AAF764_06610 [Pseudomonadota bacterium]